MIPTYGDLPLVADCLRSIYRHPPGCAYEVLVVEDASGDAAIEVLDDVPGLRFVHNEANLGFLRSCNRAAQLARGDYIFLLNSDARLTEGALDAALATFEARPDCGVVGCRLVFPDGRLQEAGGVVWRDGSAWNFGRGAVADEPRYSYVREVDYCSGAALLLRRSEFLSIGGFDERYAPAYYEDTDLSFRMRERGLKTYYCPRATVVHLEGAAHGTDPGQGGKAAQARNLHVFRRRWKHVLARHERNGRNVFRARERLQGRRVVLVMDHTLPQPERDAGSRAILHTLKQLAAMGLAVKFWPDDRLYEPRLARELEDAGVEILAGPSWAMDFPGFAREHGSDIDFAILSRPNFAPAYVAPLRLHSDARVLLYGHDLHFLRMAAQAEVSGLSDDLEAAARMFEHERALWNAVDGSIYPSEDEARIVARYVGARKAFSVPLYVFDEADLPPPSSREAGELIFVACFGHPPNEDAAEWLVRDVLPRVRQRVPEMRLRLVGSMPTDRVLALRSRDVEILADVSAAELEAQYRSASIVIAPMRFGGGVKLKVVEAMAKGVPMVTTSVGVQGLRDVGDCVAVGDDPAALADAVVELATRPEVALAMAQRAQDYVRQHYGAPGMRAALWRALAGEGGVRARCAPGA